MDREDVVRFARRDWARVAAAKTAYWCARKRGLTPAEILAIGEQLRQHARAVRPDRPSESEREADLTVHQRVTETLRAVSPRTR